MSHCESATIDRNKNSQRTTLVEKSFLRLLSQVAAGSLQLDLPQMQTVIGEGRPGLAVDLAVHNTALFRKVMMGGHIGFAESYMDGDWTSGNVTALLRFFLQNEKNIQLNPLLTAAAKMRSRLQHVLNKNSRRGSRRNISYHYDLGNDFYCLWLDPTMTYSAALFDDADESLETAQFRKYDTICDWAELAGGEHVLEVGCGWGGFAARSVETRDVTVTGLTLSEEQCRYAELRAAKIGISDKTEFRLQDYRDTNGQFDAVVSIEMFEAVGEAYWDRYFETVQARLKAGAPAVLQVITIDEDRFHKYRQSADFIQKYIFPGGFLPSPSALRRKAEDHGLVLERSHFFGLDYARTLAYWREAFLDAWPRIAPLGFDERFKRMWLYYLSYCEAGFMEKTIDVGLFKLRKPV